MALLSLSAVCGRAEYRKFIHVINILLVLLFVYSLVYRFFSSMTAGSSDASSDSASCRASSAVLVVLVLSDLLGVEEAA